MFSNILATSRVIGAKGRFIPISTAHGVRHQSSVNFQNNHILQKQNLKQSKLKSKKSKRKDDSEPVDPMKLEGQQDKSSSPISPSLEASKDTEFKSIKMVTKKLSRDYSWLPKVPSTEHILREEFNSDMLYSGYRPIVVGDKNAKENKLMQFAMKLEKLSEPVPWVSSATGQELFSEWDNVPSEIIKDLKPFHPPSVEEANDSKKKEAKQKLQKQILLNEQDKLINRKQGRKKPIIRLLDLKRKFGKE
ncbi:unnamed protein product [Kluyveromyces dobzhanskii CBS 2104]|uniref:WGS project CCBQ000000000 data, contig 00099 n=1 Tax=Kluyveromyces dobzhanskii CBS 2104 TaxID=1427455 RepID=A0A0A8L1H3_9SACH|nr:unnamed protein product [Kluyveromyces dobzhanskii CBS 2104]